MKPADDQDLAYERAVLEARADPEMAAVITDSFLDEDDVATLERFRGSEHWARIVRLLGDAGVQPPARVVDFGGGRGLVAAALATEGYEVVLCEPNPSQVCGTGAAARLRERAGVAFEIAGGDIAELEGGAYDAVVCRAVMHHVEPFVPVLRSVRAALRPGGALICSDEPTLRDPGELDRLRQTHPFVRYGVDENALTTGRYRAALEEAGFVDARILFPVAWRDYKRFVRPATPTPAAALLYLRFRLRRASDRCLARCARSSLAGRRVSRIGGQ